MEGRTATTRSVTLTPHPVSSPGPIDALTALFEHDGPTLWLEFVVEGRMSEVVWPAPAAPVRADELWRHSCFEVFVLADDGYVEYNLSPSGQWASYRFDRPRKGMRNAIEVPTPPLMDAARDRLVIESRLQLPEGARRIGLSAVIESADGTICYWALAHPSDNPDFHHPDSFILDLP